MQIYTKILIGMLVGAVIGVFFGPKSAFLEADTYTIADMSQQTFFLDPDNPASVVEMPRGASLDLEKGEVRENEVLDSTGKAFTLPRFSQVEFDLPAKLVLKDTDGSLRKKIGVERAGDRVSLWMKIESEPLPGGGFRVWPEPISGLGDTVIRWMRPLGELFMRLIKMVIVPLVFASLLVGVASLGDIRKLGRLGGRTLGLYLCTTALAVTIGLLVAHLFNPGSFIAESDRAALQAQFKSSAGDKVGSAADAPSAVENILNIIPTNPMDSLSGGNMLQIIFFSMIFGVALTLIDPKKGRVVVNFFDGVQQAMVVIIHIVMAVAPYGVAALIAEVVGTSGLSVLASLAIYGFVVLVGLILQAILVYGSIVKYIAKLNPITFLGSIRPAQLIAFSTSSSSATLPVSMECAEENLGVSNSIASFVLPLGSTVNMDGTALYQGVAAIFIAQVFQIDLSISAQLGIVLTATMASIGAAGVPGAGMVTLAMVLTAAGIPPVGVALILGVDRILDMFRTAVNVTGDLSVTAAMAALEGEKLQPLKAGQDQADPDRGFEGRLEQEPQSVEPTT